MNNLIKLDEPSLLFGHNQTMEDPRDGLTLFGPLDNGAPFGIRAGVIGTIAGINRYKKWVNKIQCRIGNDPQLIARPAFPGFEAIFKIPWKPEPAIELVVSSEELHKALYLDDKYQRVFKTVDVYADKLIKTMREEEAKVDIWFVVIPDEVYKYCRPNSMIETGLRLKADHRMLLSQAKELITRPKLFPEYNADAIPYQYEVNFHNQLKAKLLQYHCPTQIVRESTIAYHDFLKSSGKPKRDLLKLESAIAWHISTAAFYKAGGRPWKIGSIREGVCYLGVVFKRDEKDTDPRMSCCAAQMFLDSGDGVVFKGAVGPWYNPKEGDFHLKRADAREVVKLAIESYKKQTGQLPKELFLHGQVRFSSEEWQGFSDGADSSINLVGVRIREEKDLKLYRKGRQPVLRGLAYIRDERTAYLWTKGFIPRLLTYPGREVPKPILIDVCRGMAKIETILNDIMALTKLNYNACVFADGLPVTLKFADAVGEVLTAGPVGKLPPLPFRYYI